MGRTSITSSIKSIPKDYFRKEKLALRIFGLSLTDNDSFAYKIYSFVVLVFVNFLYPLLDFKEIFKHEAEVVEDMTVYQFGGFMTMAKTIIVLRNRTSIKKILAKLEKEPFTINAERGGEEEDNLFKKCIWITNVQSMTYWTIMFLTLSSAITYTLFKRIRSSEYHDWEFAYGPLTFLNVTYSPNYEISWLYQNFAVASIGWHFTTIDLLMAAILAHISFHFKILQNNIRRIVGNSYRDMCKLTDSHPHRFPLQNQSFGFYVDGAKIPWKYLQKSLKDAVEYHQAILDIANEMESVFSNLLLSIYIATLVLQGFLIFRASLLQNNRQMIKFVLESADACLQVLTVCYWGEQVAFESQQVGRAAYEANFAGTDVRFQKSLVIIIRRSQNPTKLTAGKFVDVCLPTFTWILRASYSAFMMMRSTSGTQLQL